MNEIIKGDEANFVSELYDNTLSKIEKIGDDIFIFHDQWGLIYRMYYEEDPKYEVVMESITGDINTLIGAPIELVILEQSIPQKSKKISLGREWNKRKQIRYIISTVKGGVDIRWSVGYDGNYHGEVLFEEIDSREYKRLIENGMEVTVYE